MSIFGMPRDTYVYLVPRAKSQGEWVVVKDKFGGELIGADEGSAREFAEEFLSGFGGNRLQFRATEVIKTGEDGKTEVVKSRSGRRWRELEPFAADLETRCLVCEARGLSRTYLEDIKYGIKKR